MESKAKSCCPHLKPAARSPPNTGQRLLVETRHGLLYIEACHQCFTQAIPMEDFSAVLCNASSQALAHHVLRGNLQEQNKMFNSDFLNVASKLVYAERYKHRCKAPCVVNSKLHGPAGWIFWSSCSSAGRRARNPSRPS